MLLTGGQCKYAGQRGTSRPGQGCEVSSGDSTPCNLKHELFTSGIFRVIFSDCSSLRVTETVESKAADKGGCCAAWAQGSVAEEPGAWRTGSDCGSVEGKGDSG